MPPGPFSCPPPFVPFSGTTAHFGAESGPKCTVLPVVRHEVCGDVGQTVMAIFPQCNCAP